MPKAGFTLEARDLQIAALTAQGVRQRIIAEHMGLHPYSVTRRLALPKVQAEVARLQAALFERRCAVAADQFEQVLVRQHDGYREGKAEREEQRALAQARKALSRMPSQATNGPDPHAPIAAYFLRQADGSAVSDEAAPEPSRRRTIAELLDEVAPWPPD